MDRVIGGGQEPQSWGQAIQDYQRSKRNLPWNPAQVPPPAYVKQFDVSRESREVDPILMRHRDPEVEAKKQQREEERIHVALNKAKSRQLRVEQNYDIVTHSSHLTGGKEAAPRRVRHPDSRTAYDILNHVPRENTHSLALIYPEGQAPEVMPQRVVTVEGGKKPQSHLRRDVDVLSNRFLEKHDERMIEENRFLRAKADEKYRRTHDYNLIAGAYYDDKKERDFVQSRDKLGTLQGRAQQDRLPPSVRFGEGNDYDIINKLPKKTTVVDDSGGEDEPTHRSVYAVAADRGLTKRVAGRKVHEESIRQHERKAAIDDERTLNRPSHMRHVEVLRTGHDVISNQVFTGRVGKPPPQPRARPPVSVWDKLSGPDGAAVRVAVPTETEAPPPSKYRGVDDGGRDDSPQGAGESSRRRVWGGDRRTNGTGDNADHLQRSARTSSRGIDTGSITSRRVRGGSNGRRSSSHPGSGAEDSGDRPQVCRMGNGGGQERTPGDGARGEDDARSDRVANDARRKQQAVPRLDLSRSLIAVGGS